MDMSATYLYLNQDNTWPKFARDQWQGVELGADGSLRLAALPAPDVPLPEGLDARPPAPGAAGVTAASDGSVFWTDPEASRLYMTEGCFGRTGRVCCVGSEAEGATSLSVPRGLMYHALQDRLFVADSGHNRLLVFDPSTWQLTGLWGQDGPYDSAPSSGPGRFHTPLSLAHDQSGAVYVADQMNARVQKFDPRGELLKIILHQPMDLPWRPAAVAIARDPAGAEWLVVLDAINVRLSVFGPDGGFVADHDVSAVTVPNGLAVGTEGRVYVGDRSRGRVVVYRLPSNGQPFGLVGEAHYHGPVAGLATDGRGGLLVAIGADPPVCLDVELGRTTAGHLWGGPFCDPVLVPEMWHRLRAYTSGPRAGVAIRLSIFKEGVPGAGPPSGPPWMTGPLAPPVVDLADVQTAAPPLPGEQALGRWYRAPWGAPECIFPGSLMEQLWVALELAGDGASTPIVSQLRLDFQYERLADRLPACYTSNNPNRALVSRLIGLFASLFEDTGQSIGRFVERFDPAAAPADALPGLAALLGLDPRPDTPEMQLRDDIAAAPHLYEVRGTAAGLSEALARTLNTRVVIEEPIRQVRVWSLPDSTSGDPLAGVGRGVGSLLGLTTMLASSEPQGAVLGSTLTLGQTEVITEDEIGLGLFGDLAHRIVVCVPDRSRCVPGYEDSVRKVLDRELPAHLGYDLCLISPKMRLGVQARLGIDAVVAGPDEPTILGDGPDAAVVGILTGGPWPGALGAGAALGQTTFLSDTTPDDPAAGGPTHD